MSQEELLNCYNRGCGKKFNPHDNKEDDCIHHPGLPVFHDAYKGWSCCNKKCTDFTEFLNIKGCTKSKHTNEKPAELEKPVIDKSKADEVIIVENKPLQNRPQLERPPFNSPQVTLIPTISPRVLEQIEGLTINDEDVKDEDKVTIGQTCKNNSCNATYSGPESLNETCIYHPGTPIFHEGMKYWSCCNKKTTDFSTFLAQPGCMQGNHVWLSKNTNKKVQCRMDWHQTGTLVVISIFAKKYIPNKSSVKLNPIHLSVDLYFLEENSNYNLDIELRGIVDVAQSNVSMLPTKVEITLRKAEPGSWAKLDFPRTINEPIDNKNVTEETTNEEVENVDLSDL